MLKKKDGKSTYLISVAGASDGSFAYYIAKALTKMPNMVLLIDNSRTNDVFLSLAKGREDETDNIPSQNMLTTRHIAWSPSSFIAADFVVVWHGMDIDETLWNYSDLRLLTTNYNRFDVDKLSNVLGDLKRDLHLVFIDKVGNKVKEKTIADKLGIGDIDIFTSEGHSIIDMDVKNHAAYEAFTYNGMQSLKEFSADYISVIRNSLAFFYKTKEDKKIINKVIAQTK